MMKKIVCSAAGVLASVLPVQAEVVSAVLYPTGAVLTEKIEAVLPEDGHGRVLTFYVPADARGDGLSVRTAEAEVLSVSVRPLKAFEQDERRAVQEKELEEARAALAAQLDEKSVLQASKKFWLGMGNTVSDAEEAQKMDSAMQARLQQIAVRLHALESEIKAQRRVVSQLEDAWTALGESQLVVAALNKALPGKTAHVVCSYATERASWQARYRFDAQPAQGKVGMTLFADIVLDGGSDWNNVQIELATLRPDGALAPPAIHPWIISKQSEPEPRLLRVGAAVMNTAELEDSAPMAAEAKPKASRPIQRARGTYAVWNIGEHSVSVSRPCSVPLAEHMLDAEFSHTLRPGVSDAAFLTAEAVLPEGQELTDGMASYSIDGTLAGEGRFSLRRLRQRQLSSKEKVKDAASDRITLFFGQDRQVYCKRINLSLADDQKGFFSKSQLKEWEWRMEIISRRAEPVRVRVEDAAPQALDKRINLKTTAVPEPQTADEHVLIWRGTVEAGKPFIITYKVEASAPEEVPMHSSR